MGVIRPPKPVQLICGMFSNDPDLMARAVQLMRKMFGPTDEVTERWPFASTEYYELEMGDGLERQFAAFERLVNPEELPYIKRQTNDLENRICTDCGLPPDSRRVNLDPGYLSLGKLVLATTKDASHRVYLRDGIYAESTLYFMDGHWQARPWTYPDFAAETYHPFFDGVRERLKAKLTARQREVEPPEKTPW